MSRTLTCAAAIALLVAACAIERSEIVGCTPQELLTDDSVGNYVVTGRDCCGATGTPIEDFRLKNAVPSVQ